MPDMDSRPEYYETGLEAAPQNFPELSHRESRAPEVAYHQPYHHQPYTQLYPSYHDVAIPKPQEPSYGSQAGSSSPFAPFSSTTAHSMRKEPKKILGCPVLVFILSCIIALLSIAVIGLAAATGVEAARASESDNRAASMSMQLAAGPTATATVTISPSPSATNTLTNGCTDDPDGVSNTNYTSFSLLGGIEFTRFCNKDTIHPPLLSLFTADFETCIDACAGYSKYIPTMFAKNANTTCAGVSFVPLWTVKDTAEAGGAPGNCYLKSGPMKKSDLKAPNIGTECHAAILADP